ncbi:MAG TPA: hypothetical protein VNY27_08005 [Solirubrobacteraceae bacterium]|nr:hypothetical protein [Solirubrobacteraceae bacterium]
MGDTLKPVAAPLKPKLIAPIVRSEPELDEGIGMDSCERASGYLQRDIEGFLEIYDRPSVYRHTRDSVRRDEKGATKGITEPLLAG